MNATLNRPFKSRRRRRILLLASLSCSLTLAAWTPTTIAGDRKPPEGAQLAELQALAKAAHGDQNTAIRSREDALMRAEALMSDADELADSPDDQYVLLRIAGDAFIIAGDPPGIETVVDAIDEQFDIDALAMKAELLKAATLRTGGVESITEALLLSDRLVKQVIDEDRYDQLDETLSLAAYFAKRTGSASAVRRVNADLRRAKEIAVAFEDASRAKRQLESNPESRTAGREWGEFLCYYKGHWEEGLPLLQRAPIDATADLIEQELPAPTQADQQLALADGWWARAQTLKPGVPQQTVRRRAAYWYRQALPNLNGLKQKAVQARLDEAELKGVPFRRAFRFQSAAEMKQFWRWTGPWRVSRDGARVNKSPAYVGTFATRHRFRGDTTFKMTLELGTSRWRNTGGVRLDAFGQSYWIRTGGQWQGFKPSPIELSRRGDNVRFKVGDKVEYHKLTAEQAALATPILMWVRSRKAIRIVDVSIQATESFDEFEEVSK